MAIRPSQMLATALAAVLPVAIVSASVATPTIRVTYQDLNLATAAGVTALYQRVQRAAGDYCGATRDLTGTRVSPQFSRCVKDAVASTVKQIDVPRLTALHAARSGTSAG